MEKKLNEFISNPEERVTVYHQLRVLLQERDKSRFHILLQFLSFLQTLNPRFLAYFKEYVSQAQEWAYAYQIGCGINSNMYVQCFIVY